LNDDRMLEILHKLSIECGFITAGIANPSRFISSNLAWAKAAISLALKYPHDHFDQSKPICTGSVASFAVGPDYHIVVSERLHQFAESLSLHFPGRYSIHVDDPLISERALALHAGIGWIGCNKCLFVPGHGSFVLLGEILTDVEYPLHSAIQDCQCGSCTMCIDACPSGALSRDHIFNRERCISQLTQSRGIISNEFMPLIGNHIYGCDICQSVCPYNQHNMSINREIDSMCYPGPHPNLCDVIQLSPTEWTQKVRNSSVGWIGRTAWRRNAIIATANANLIDARELLLQMTTDKSPIIASTALRAIAQLFY